MSKFEVLLESRGSRVPLTVTTETLYPLVQNTTKINIAPPTEAHGGPSTAGNSGEDIYVLQCFSDKWSAFVDVQKSEEVKEGDRLTLLLKVISIMLTCN